MSIATTSLTLYGLANCDTVRKARHWLSERGIEAAFHDFKQHGLDTATALRWAEQLGDWQPLVNRRGTTWRQLPAEVTAAVVDAVSAAQLMSAHPSVVKRPVVQWPDGALTVGFDADDWARRLNASLAPR